MPRITKQAKKKAWDGAKVTMSSDYHTDPLHLDDMGRLSRAILWTSSDGKYAVVPGPFPYGFRRTLDSKTVEGAAKLHVTGNIISRPQTTRSDRFAKVRMVDIVPTHNEHGEIAP